MGVTQCEIFQDEFERNICSLPGKRKMGAQRYYHHCFQFVTSKFRKQRQISKENVLTFVRTCTTYFIPSVIARDSLRILSSLGGSRSASHALPKYQLEGVLDAEGRLQRTVQFPPSHLSDSFLLSHTCRLMVT